MSVQLAPPAGLMNTPLPAVPAYTMLEFCGSMAREPIGMFGMPVLATLQLAPPSVLLKTAPSGSGYVPAYSVLGVWGSIAMARTRRVVSPVLMARQVEPPSVLLKT